MDVAEFDPTDLSTLSQLRRAGRGYRSVEQRPRMLEKDTPGRRQFHAPSRAFEQWHTDLFLQRLDALGEWRLGNEQTSRRTTKVLFVGDCNKSPDISEFHKQDVKAPSRLLHWITTSHHLLDRIRHANVADNMPTAAAAHVSADALASAELLQAQVAHRFRAKTLVHELWP